MLENIVELIFGVGGMFLGFDQFPLVPVDFGQVGISLDRCLHSREMNFVDLRKGEPVNFSAADKKRLRILVAAGYRVFDRVCHNRAGKFVVGITSYDDRRTAGKKSSDRFKRFSPHDDRVSHR